MRRFGDYNAYTVRTCPLCGGDDVQLAHGRCAKECRNDDGLIPPMDHRTAVLVDDLPEHIRFELWGAPA